MLYGWDIVYRVQGVVISPDGQRMVTISSEKEIDIYDYPSRAHIRELRPNFKMTCISVSRNSRYILVSHAHDEINLYDLDTGEMIRRYMGQKQNTFVLRSTFGGRDHNMVLSGSEGGYQFLTPSVISLTLFQDSKVYIWNKESGILLETLEGHSRGCVNAVSWNPADVAMFATGGDDAKIRM